MYIKRPYNVGYEYIIVYNGGRVFYKNKNEVKNVVAN